MVHVMFTSYWFIFSDLQAVCALDPLFVPVDPLFSSSYRLFCENTGGRGVPAIGGYEPGACLTFHMLRVLKRLVGIRLGDAQRIATRSPSPHGRAMRSQGSRAHTKSGREGWWYIPQRISATRAASFVRGSRRGIRAQPVTARFAQLVDALNRESRQILHRFLRNCVALSPCIAFRLRTVV
jgi:hypothetical protein